MPTIMSLFGRQAPFAGMQTHMRLVKECADHVVPLTEALLADDADALKREAKAIFALESRADDVKNDLRLHLPRSLFMPIDRRDLLQVLHAQDSIADVAEDVAGMFLARKMPVPEPMREPLLAQVKGCVGVVALAEGMIDQLDELVEVGFRGKYAEQIEALAAELNAAEHQTDRLERQLRAAVFALEEELGPVSVILWLDLIEWIGDLADYAETVGNTLRLMVAR